MKTISLTIPVDYNALSRASDMLHGLAIDLKHAGAPEAKVTRAPIVGPSTTAVDDQHVTEPTEVFGEQQPAAPNPSLFPEQPEEATKEQQPAAPNPSLFPEQPAGVDLAPATTNPQAAIPWDARIHAGSKAKLSKKPHGWKMKRGVAADLVATVEAELIAAMAASPANPVEPSAPASTITTFPELMAKITASGIDPATVTAAVNSQGLQALPLLAARPDLIPAVAAQLF